MRRSIALMMVVASGCGPSLAPPPADAVAPVSEEAAERGVVWEETFDRAGVAELGWGSPSEASPDEIAAVFQIASEGDERFLRAHHDASRDDAPPAVHFGRAWKEHALPLDQACELRFRWRARQHPAKADDPWLDLGASVYVIVDLPGVLSSGKGFKLGWLQTAGATAERQLGIVQIALRGESTTDTWHDERVDLCALHREHYGGDPREVSLLYVGVVTDADDTESVAEADYDAFRVSRPRVRRGPRRPPTP